MTRLVNWKEIHIGCPCGKSSDAYCIDKNDWGTCFSCGSRFPPHKAYDDASHSKSNNNWINESELIKRETEELQKVTEEEIAEAQQLTKGKEWVYEDYRGIKADVRQMFGSSLLKNEEDQVVSVCYPYSSIHSDSVDQPSMKIRYPKQRPQRDKFGSIGEMSEYHLFGKEIFAPNQYDSITITEGEEDAMAMFDALNNKSACVSVRSAASAYGDCKVEHSYINSFKKIYIAFDNDGPGKDAANKVAPLFDVDKVYYVPFVKHKDANAYLQNEGREELRRVWMGSKKFSPDNVISSFVEIRKALDEETIDQICPYPISKLQQMLSSLHTTELVCFKGPEGIGKTEVFRMIESHILKVSDIRIGIIHLEEPRGQTIRAIASYHHGAYPFHHPDFPSSPEEVMKYYVEATGNDEDRVHIYSNFDTADHQKFLDTVRWMIAVAGCKVVLVDNISYLATGQEEVEDERRKLDLMATKFKNTAEELNACIIIISHTNDEGKTRGSRYITKVSDTVINLYRDREAFDEFERRKLYLSVEKARLTGETGPAGFVEFDPEVKMLKDTYIDYTSKEEF